MTGIPAHRNHRSNARNAAVHIGTDPVKKGHKKGQIIKKDLMIMRYAYKHTSTDSREALNLEEK